MRSERPVRIGPAIALGVVCMFAGIWVFIAVQHRMGLTTQAEHNIERTGTAEVQSCSGSPAYLWMTVICDARVRWDGEQETATTRVHSVHELSGMVTVQLRNEGRGRSGGTVREVVTADFPFRPDGGLFFVLLVGIPGMGLVLGFLAGNRLSRLLPEPAPEKLVLRPMARTRRPGDQRSKRSRKRRG